MNKNMSFTQYQKKYITSFECQYDTMSTWGFYINIENNDKNDNDKNDNDKNDNDNVVKYKLKYINQTFFNCLLKTAPCIMMFYCFT